MPAEVQIHPLKEQLVAFGLGKLDPNETTQIERHLESCSDCCETILDLADDTFVGLVRKCDAANLADPSNATLDLGSGTPPVASRQRSCPRL